MKKLLFILTTAISLGYCQSSTNCDKFRDSIAANYNYLADPILNQIYVDSATNTIYTVDLMIHNGKAQEIDSIVVIYDTKVTIFIDNVEYIVPNAGESMYVWINLTQYQCKYPPYDLFDLVYLNSPKVYFDFN